MTKDLFNLLRIENNLTSIKNIKKSVNKGESIAFNITDTFRKCEKCNSEIKERPSTTGTFIGCLC